MRKIIYLSLIILTQITPFSAYSQDSDITKAKQAKDRLVSVIDKIGKLDNEIKTVYYINVSSFQEYDERLKKVKLILNDLDGSEKEFNGLSQNNKTEKDYYIKLAYIDLVALSIYSQREEYFGFLKFSQRLDPILYKDNITLYNKDFSDWENLEIKHLSNALSKVRVIKNYDPLNYDARIITSILNYFDKNNDLAIQSLKEDIRSIDSLKVKSIGIEETVEANRKLGFLYSWLAYIQLENNMEDQAIETLRKVSMFPESELNLTWAKNALKKINLHKVKGYDLKNGKVEFPKSTVSWNADTVEFTYNGTEKNGLKIVTTPRSVNCSPMELIALLKSSNYKLIAIENQPYQKAFESLKQSVINQEKAPYKDPNSIFVKIDASNKGFSENNLELYYNRFNDALSALNSYYTAYTGWNNLVKSNPKNIFYRIYRIKSNLGIYYISKHYDTFISFLDYYRIDKHNIPQNIVSEIQNIFNGKQIDEISEDFVFLGNLAPNNILAILTRMEVLMYTESADVALSGIKDLELEIDENAEILGIDPKLYINLYNTHLYFEMRNWKEYYLSLQRIKEYNNNNNNNDINEWIKSLRSRHEFFMKEESYSANANTRKFTRFIPENFPAPIFFPVSIDLTQTGTPPFVIADNEDLCKSSISSQYFRLAIPSCVDMTNNADYIKKSLADIFYTAFFETNRFNLIDRNEIEKTEDAGANEIRKDTSQANQHMIGKVLQINELGSLQKRKDSEYTKSRSDAVLEIKITSDAKNVKNDAGKIVIDYRVVRYYRTISTEPVVLIAGTKEISYTFNKSAESLSFSRQDVNDITLEIKNKFPNPEIRDDLKIISKRGTIITVNAGKNDNIISGMLGFVIKVNKDVNENKSICYRAEFQVTEVFQDSFNAILYGIEPEDKLIISTIKAGEFVKMK